jgi:hypothetical protein
VEKGVPIKGFEAGHAVVLKKILRSQGNFKYESVVREVCCGKNQKP